jgi:hypothetical protein
MSRPTHSPRERAERRAGTEHLTEDEYHGLLSAERRREALEVLSESTPPAELEDLAAAVAARETDERATDEAAVERVAVALHHAHLPMMDALGVVDYDPGSRRVVWRWH